MYADAEVASCEPYGDSSHHAAGIVGNAIYSCPHSFTGLHMIADGFLVGNALLFVVLTALLLTRFASNPSFLRTFKHDP